MTTSNSLPTGARTSADEPARPDQPMRPVRPDRSDLPEPRPRFRDLVAGEWLKLWSMRSMRLGFLIGALGIIGLNVNAAIADLQDWARFAPDYRAHFVPGGSFREAFTNNAGITVLLVAGTLGAISLVSEYASGLIRVSFAAVPARRSLFAAKVVVLTAAMLGFGLVVTFGSFWATQAILSEKHAGISLDRPGIWSGLAAAVVLPAVSALVGFGLAALIRHSAASVVAVVTVLLLVPDFLTPTHYWTACLFHATPFRAFQLLYDLTPYQLYGFQPYPAHAVDEWWVMLLWPLGAVVLALTTVKRRDV